MENVDISEFETIRDMCKEGGSARPLIDKQSTDIKVKIYGLGKQGTEGDNTAEKPGMFSIKEKKKWEAHEANRGMDRDEAKRQFLVLAKSIIEKK